MKLALRLNLFLFYSLAIDTHSKASMWLSISAM